MEEKELLQLVQSLKREVANLNHRVKVLESRSRVLCGGGKTEFVHILVEEYALEQARKKREAVTSRTEH